MAEQLTLLVESSKNFRFLSEPALVLAADAAAAELYIDSDPDAAMVKARRFAETLAKMLVKQRGLDPKKIKDQNGRIEALAEAGVIPQPIQQAFHAVRRAGNQAAHDRSGDKQKAASTVAACFELGAWWYQTETGRKVAHSFTHRPAAETAPLRESLENIESQLAELQASFQSESGRTLAKSTVLRIAVAAAVTVVVAVAAVATYLVGPAQRSSADNPASGGPPASVAPSGPPVAAVTSFDAVSCRSSGWVVPGRGSAPIPYSGDRPSAEAVLGSNGQITITVQGLAGRSVVLQSMEVDVLRRAPAMPGTYLPVGCEGGILPRKFLLDLNVTTPRVVVESGSVSFPYKVNEVEPEQFLITPVVRDADVEFRLILRWTSGADKGELVLPEPAQPPFRVTAPTAAREFCLDLADSMWRPSC
jgi:hypothetical protein